MRRSDFWGPLGLTVAAALADPIATLLRSGKAWSGRALIQAIAATQVFGLLLYIVVATLLWVCARRWLDKQSQRLAAATFSATQIVVWSLLYPGNNASTEHYLLAGALAFGLGLAAATLAVRAQPSASQASHAIPATLALATVFLLIFVWAQKYWISSALSASSLGAAIALCILVTASAMAMRAAPRYAAAVSLGLVIAFVIIAAGGVIARSRDGAHGEATALAKGKPSILLLTVDTLRADQLRCGTSRGLEKLCAEATEFTENFSPAPWTLPALASIHTGVSPLVHGALEKASKVPAAIPTLAETLENAGFRTHAIADSSVVRPSRGILDGFQTTDLYPAKRPPSFSTLIAEQLDPWLPTRARLRTTTADIAEITNAWLESNLDRPFFLWVHAFDPHAPYAPPDEYLPTQNQRRRRFHGLRDIVEGTHSPSAKEQLEIRALYDGEAAYVRDSVDRIVNRLDELTLLDDMLVIVTSDHGEEFFEHGRVGHGHTLYDELLRVPLLVKLPGRRGPHRATDIVTTERIVASVLQAVGVDAPHSHLWPPLPLGGEALDPPPAEKPLISAGMLFFQPRIGLRTADYKYVWEPASDRRELYDLASEPGEWTNLGTTNVELLAQAHQTVEEALAQSLAIRADLGLGSAAEDSLDPAAEQQLRALGYIQ